MPDQQVEVRYRSADGSLNLYAASRGPANAPLSVLCLHGLTRNGRDFDSLAARLAQRYRVVVADQRGRGRSAWDPHAANYQLPVYTQDMLRLLDELKIERVALVGTSMGGLISLLLAFSAPNRVHGIVLNDIGPEVPPVGLKRLRESLTAPASVKSWEDAATLARRVNGSAFPDYQWADWEAFAKRLFLKDSAGNPLPGYDPAILQGLTQTPNEGAAAPTLWPLFEHLKSLPMLAIRGGLSDILSAETLERMTVLHPDLSSLTLPNRGHAPMLDEPPAAAAIEAFLRRLEHDPKS